MATARTAVAIVSMPWNSLKIPSIQLGILKPVLERAGLEASVHSFNLEFAEHLATALASLGRDFTIDDYRVVSTGHSNAGEWVFAVPPFCDEDPAADSEHLARFTAEGFLPGGRSPDEAVALLRAMRGVVPAFLEACAAEVLARHPRVVGFTTTFLQTVPSLALTRILKARDPSIRVVFGGSNCDGPMGEALLRAYPEVDVVVRGEGEQVFPEVARDLIEGRDVRPLPGLCFRRDGQVVIVPMASGTIPMDDVPTPDYDEHFERVRRLSFGAEVLARTEIQFESARGCWWGERQHCTFCGLNGTTMAFRSQSPGKVLGQLTELARRHEHLDFRAVDNIIDLAYFDTVFPRLKALGLDLGIFYETKSNLKKHQIRIMGKAGVRSVNPGIETLSTPILKLMRKGVTAFQNIRLLKWCAQYGIEVLWSIILGFPGEPPEEYARMAALVPSLAHLPPPRIGPLRVERFSPYFQDPARFGIELGEPVGRPVHRGLDEATLRDLSYDFDFRYLDGRDPMSYARVLVDAVGAWAAHAGVARLVYRRGPGFLEIVDTRRPDVPGQRYVLDELSAAIYLACDAGATPVEIQRTVPGASLDDVREVLDELLAERLLYVEDGRYLSLALPADPEAAEESAAPARAEAPRTRALLV